MRVNVARPYVHTHEGAVARHITPAEGLRRAVMSCMLWENEFYEDGKSIAERILELAGQVPVDVLAATAVEARTAGNLRHAPLLLLTALVKHGKGRIVADTIEATIQRADELAEFVALYWKAGKRPLSAQMKKGLARAFLKFDAYQLGKYNRDAAVKLRDVLFLSHAKPDGEERAALWKRLVDGTLESPDTWEVNLSGGADKKETFERLLRERKLGYLALLRNLRGMMEAGVEAELVREAILGRRGGADKVLPFRFVAAARACPQMEPALDYALQVNIAEGPLLKGQTVVLVDVSGSMASRLSAKSDMTRMDAAAALASVVNGNVRVFTFSNQIVEVPARRGMAGVDAVIRSQPHASTYLGQAVATLNAQVPCDRLIVISDEQSHDAVPNPLAPKAYMINVASARNGVGYRGGWTHIDGFSESVLRYIAGIEA